MLTPARQREYLKIIDLIERSNAARRGYPAELADLRGIPLDDLMERLTTVVNRPFGVRQRRK